MKLRRSSNGSLRRDATQQGLKWQLAPFWRSHAQREKWRREAHLWPSSLPKSTPRFPRRRRRPQSWRAPPRPKMETLPRGVRTMSTPPTCSTMSSTPSVPYRALAITVNGSYTCIPSSITASEGRSSAGAWQPSGGDSSTNQTFSRRSSGSSSFSRVSPHWRKVSIGLRGHDMEEAHHRRGYASMENAGGGGQPRGALGRVEHVG